MEIFFSRAWLCFDQILNFHRAGNLHFDSEICALVYKTELGMELTLKIVSEKKNILFILFENIGGLMSF